MGLADQLHGWRRTFHTPGERRMLLRLAACIGSVAVTCYATLVLYGMNLVDLEPATDRKPAVVEDQQAVAAKYKAKLRLVDARIEAHSNIVHDLIDKRINLRQAVAAYQDLDQRLPDPCAQATRETFPAPTEAGCYARQILAHAEYQLRQRPQEATTIRERLRAEFDELGQ